MFSQFLLYSKVTQSYIYIHSFSHIIFLLVLSPETRYNSLCYRVGTYCLSILKVIVCSLPYDPAIPLLGIHPGKTFVQDDTGTAVFTAALFTTAEALKQPTCPSTEEWIKKIWYLGVPVMVQRKQIRLGTMRLQVQSLASLSGLRIRHCCELWC